MVQTLLHIPLLRPGNTEARCVYLALVPSLLSYSLESGVLVEEARQLLSYVLIHPALRDDRRFTPKFLHDSTIKLVVINSRHINFRLDFFSVKT